MTSLPRALGRIAGGFAAVAQVLDVFTARLEVADNVLRWSHALVGKWVISLVFEDF